MNEYFSNQKMKYKKSRVEPSSHYQIEITFNALKYFRPQNAYMR